MSQPPERNNQNAMAFYDLMFNQCKPAEAVARCAGDTYIQHNPHVADGKQAFIDCFERVARDYPGKRVHFKRAVAEAARGRSGTAVAKPHISAQLARPTDTGPRHDGGGLRWSPQKPLSEGAQDTGSHARRHVGKRRRVERVGTGGMKADARRLIRGLGRLEDAVDDAAMEMDVLVQA